MSISTKTPDHTQISNSLKTLQISQSASEIYGLLCAIISAHAAITKEAWVNGLITLDIDTPDIDTKEINVSKKTLEELYTWTQEYLDQDDRADFVLILPDAKVDFESTLSSLIYFSQGFLSGLNLCKINTETQQENPDLKEALESLIQVACLDDNEKDTSSNQEALDLCTTYTKDAVSIVLSELKLPAPSNTKN